MTLRGASAPDPGDVARTRRAPLKATVLSPPRGGRVFEKIVGHVRDAILAGRLKPGDRLPPERELVRRFRVGRGAVREAFRILEQSALIRIRPGKGGGAFVAGRPTEAVTRSLSDLLRFGGISLDDVVKARLALEGLVIDLIARHADADHLARLSDSVERAARFFGAGRRTEKREEDFNFHVLLAEATGNAMYPLLIRSVVDVMDPIVAEVGVPDVLMRRTLDAHRAIVSHLVRRQGAAAKRALTRHLLEGHAHLRRDNRPTVRRAAASTG
jgi:DNA-binding FadR family transcriptional regulator